MSSMTTAGSAPGTSTAAADPDSSAGRTFEAYRAYLTLVARQEMGPALAGRVGASDIVQETFLAARRCADAFRGRTEPQWRAWLRSILLHHLANLRRRQSIEKRRPPAEGPWADGVTPPSRQLMRRERDAALAAAMGRLPEHYRRIIAWHHDDRLTFVEIARRTGTSPDAAQKLWARALIRLRELLGPEHDPR